MSATAAGAATSKSRKYDVFINHRGPDVNKTFVAHLYDALSSRGFRPFLDAEDIAYTRPVFEEIDKALEDASVHVAIFSKGYAESIYCLDELCEMLKSKQPIIPVFYDVEAGDLRRIEDGPYNDAFIKHQMRGRTQKIPIWKEALRKVADYRGFRMDEVNGNEHQLIRRILVEVRIVLCPDLLLEKRFGLEKSMKDVVKILESVSVIGLVGMGGIGKTTLAMEIYNHFLSHQHFENYCFLRDVRSSQTSLLQLKVLRDLHLDPESHCNDQEYRRTLNGALKNRRVLLIVDDISDANQFKALIPEILIILGLDCRIVITSQRHDVLNHVMKALPTTSKSVYEVQMLDKFDSRRLFNFHAFMSETPREDFVELAETIADACGGLPLALEVMGSYLFDKEKPQDKMIWLEAVNVLQENPEIMDRLRVSYDGLPTTGEKEMFQDIACMLIGVKQEVAMAIWKSCRNCGCGTSRTPASSLRNLIDRSLVKLDEHDRLRMHDVLRDMGREIVKTDGVKGQTRPPKKWRHLWDPAIALKELRRGEVNTKVRGICLAVQRDDEDDENDEPYENDFLFSSSMSCEASNLESMKELHLLILDGCHVVHANFIGQCQELRWLQWRFYSSKSCPPHLELPRLVVLDLTDSTQLTCLWEPNGQMMVNLAQLVVLDLTYCSKLICLWENNAPIQLPLLEELILEGCSTLVALPENLGECVPSLRTLKMTRCGSLQRLPNSIGLLRGLQHLSLAWCSKLITLMNARVELVNMPKLTVVDLSYCETLSCLWEDDTRIELPLLEELILEGCFSLVALPEDLGECVPSLRTLKMSYCGSLQRLPNSLGLLRGLQHLSLAWCSKLITLMNAHVELVNMPNLTVVDLSYCKTLSCLWEDDARIEVNMPNLLVLDLNYCETLSCLWEDDARVELPLLEQLILEGCSSLVALPENLDKCVPSLRTLEMSYCGSLQRLPNSLGLLRGLQYLSLELCSKLITLMNAHVELVNMPNLLVLDLNYCETLSCLWEDDARVEVPMLQVLILEGCSSLVALPENLGKRAPSLKRLVLRGCKSLQLLPNSIDGLTKLEHWYGGE